MEFVKVVFLRTILFLVFWPSGLGDPEIENKPEYEIYQELIEEDCDEVMLDFLTIGTDFDIVELQDCTCEKYMDIIQIERELSNDY